MRIPSGVAGNWRRWSLSRWALTTEAGRTLGFEVNKWPLSHSIKACTFLVYNHSQIENTDSLIELALKETYQCVFIHSELEWNIGNENCFWSRIVICEMAKQFHQGGHYIYVYFLTLEESNHIDSHPPAHFRKLTNIRPFYGLYGLWTWWLLQLKLLHIIHISWKIINFWNFGFWTLGLAFKNWYILKKKNWKDSKSNFGFFDTSSLHEFSKFIYCKVASTSTSRLVTCLVL